MQINKKHILLLLVFAFSFIFRMLLMLWDTYPPGADIGLHNSVIYSITGSGNTNFLWNFYQIGGGLSLTFPGYHIFAAGVIMMTGLPEYIAHTVIVSFFSSLIVLAAFLVTRSVWNETAAFVVAFLAAISRFDIEMLLWGGYPNVITLLLIPLTFYLFLQKDRFSKTPFLVSTSILAGSIFLTHSLSAAILVGITVLTVLFVVISPKTFGTSRKTGLYWLVPLILGVALVSPFLINAVPAYLSQNSSALGVQGVSDINSAVLSTRILPLEQVLPLFLIILGFALFSRRYNGKYITLPTLLLCVWLFVPLFLTQGYLFGFIIDYNRFQYFVILPVLIFMGVLISHGSEFFANGIQFVRALNVKVQKTETATNKKVAWLSAHATKKTLFAGFILFFLLFSALVLPIFMTPSQNMGESIQSFYQFMNQPGWEAIQWIKANTSANSVLVSDAHYGWWLSGFALRPTLSAVDPQYLTLAREFPIAKNASNLLDTDFLVDNYLVQVREDGGYIARHNPEILANLNWTYFPYSFFTFDGSQTEIKYEINASLLHHDYLSAYLSQLEVKDMRLISNADQATIVVSRGNDYFNYTQLTTVYRGMRFVNLTATLDSTVPDVTIDWLNIDVQSKGTQIYSDQRTIAMVDVGVKTFGQLIFAANQPNATTPVTAPLFIDLEYRMQNPTHGQIQILASAYSADNNPAFYTDSQSIDAHFYPVIADNVNHPYPAPTNDGFKECFDYRTMLQNYNVSYVACTIPEMYPKFTRDQAFSLVFINSEVAIFSVKGNLGQDG
jgi:hypothetical protein